MSVSISGQNDREALLGAYQPTPIPRQGQNGAWDSAVGTAAPTGSTSTPTAAPGGTSGALSDGVSFALMALDDGNRGTAASVPAAGPSSASSDLSSADPAAAQSSQSRLLTDIQSLLSMLTGASSPSNSGSGTSNTASAAAGTQTDLSNTTLQDPQAVTADLGTIASASGTSQPAGPGAQPPGSPPSWSNDISNAGTSAPNGTTSRWKPGYNDGFRQQFALSAYSANAASGLNGATASSLASINV